MHAYRVIRHNLPGAEDVVGSKEKGHTLTDGAWRIQVPTTRIVPRRGTITPQEAAVRNSKKSSKSAKVVKPSAINDRTYAVVEQEIPFPRRSITLFDPGINPAGIEQIVTAAMIAKTNDLHPGNFVIQTPDANESFQ